VQDKTGTPVPDSAAPKASAEQDWRAFESGVAGPCAPGQKWDDRRARLVAAFSKAAAEQGYSRLDVSTVARYGGVSVAEFEEHFQSVEQALVAAQEAFLERLWLDIEAACEGAGEWPEKVRDAVAAVIDSLVEASAIARVFAIEAPGVSFAAAERQYAALNCLAAVLRVGRRSYTRAASLPDSSERALVGGTVSIVCEHLLAEDPTAIPRLRGELVELLLSPYLGEEEARRVAAQ
jgi:AcrR family transcriptional regulator